MKVVIGRGKEQKELLRAYHSPRPEFIALYGRRRVCKTFLVRNTLESNEEMLFLNSTGLKNWKPAQQIKNFTQAIGNTF